MSRIWESQLRKNLSNENKRLYRRAENNETEYIVSLFRTLKLIITCR